MFEQPTQHTPRFTAPITLIPEFTAPITWVEDPPATRSRRIGRSILALLQQHTRATLRAVKRYGAWLRHLEFEL
jgi:hypothetical protein